MDNEESRRIETRATVADGRAPGMDECPSERIVPDVGICEFHRYTCADEIVMK